MELAWWGEFAVVRIAVLRCKVLPVRGQIIISSSVVSNNSASTQKEESLHIKFLVSLACQLIMQRRPRCRSGYRTLVALLMMGTFCVAPCIGFGRMLSLPREKVQQRLLIRQLSCTKTILSVARDLSEARPADTPIIPVVEGPWNVTQFANLQCWGTRPVLLRGAFATELCQKNVMPSWQDIVDLASLPDDDDDDDEIEYPLSRLIRHRPGRLDSFQLQIGPFQSDDLLSLNVKEDRQNPKDKVTLVVNDVDRFIPTLSDWMDRTFSFLPRWRRDDAQISLAPTGGGIGPHVDNYDVFLIQMSGSRKWDIGRAVSTAEEYKNLVPQSQVRVLDLNVPVTSLDLYPGDCLYLPPRILHQGQATSPDCMTLSVGGRAPSASELLSRVAEYVSTVAETNAATAFYTDPELPLQTMKLKDKNLDALVVSGVTKDKMKQLLCAALEEVLQDDSAWDSIVGEATTVTRRPTAFETYPVPLSDMDEEHRFSLGEWGDASKTIQTIESGKGSLYRTEGVSFAASRVGTSPKYRLFAHGKLVCEVNCVSDSAPALFSRIANGPPIDKKALDTLGVTGTAADSSLVACLKKLVEDGFLYGSHSVVK